MFFPPLNLHYLSGRGNISVEVVSLRWRGGEHHWRMAHVRLLGKVVILRVRCLGVVAEILLETIAFTKIQLFKLSGQHHFFVFHHLLPFEPLVLAHELFVLLLELAHVEGTRAEGGGRSKSGRCN